MRPTILDREQLLRELPGARAGIFLKDLTTMHVGGIADAVYDAKTVGNLVQAVVTAYRLGYPYKILGSGSNVVAADAGYAGLIIRNQTSTVVVLPDESVAIADSGVTVARMLNEALTRDLGGMEYFAGLPGTVGGALYGNAECWGHSVSEYLEQATLLLPAESQTEPRLVSVEPDWFSFQYRSSKLKRMPDGPAKPIILTARFKLRRRPKEAIMVLMKEYRDKRHELSQPIGSFCSGSFFRNPGGSSHTKAPLDPWETAGYLVDQAGGKKLKVGGAAVSKMHANFLTNLGSASAADVKALAEEIKRQVETQFGVKLQEEVEYLGDWEGARVGQTENP